MTVKSCQELIVWQKAMDLVEAVYKASKSFPREEIQALTSQIRRGLFRCRQTSPKVKDVVPPPTSFDTSRLHMARYLRLKRRF